MRPARSKSLVYDIYGAYVRDAGGWISIADLVVLLGHLGVDEQAVRSSVSRISRKGMLIRERRDGQVGYKLSDAARRMLDEGDEAIFTVTRPARVEDGWVLVLFSVPEGERDKRHQLRAGLTWLGYGNLGNGAWVAPRRTLARTLESVGRMGLEPYVDVFEADYRAFGTLQELVRRCWDLDQLAGMYAEFVDRVGPTLDRWIRGDVTSDVHLRAFVDYTGALHEWRKMPFLDPGLPTELLPDDWQGQTATELFREVVARLEKPARAYVESVLRTP